MLIRNIKKANFNNKKDACESYGFNEKTTPIWATKFMSTGYSIMLAIWLFIGSFTFMPVIFIAKKMSVGLKKNLGGGCRCDFVVFWNNFCADIVGIFEIIPQ